MDFNNEKSEKYNFITKKIKIAYRRWDRKCKSEGEDFFSDLLMASGVYLVSVSQHRAKQPEITFQELIVIVQKEQDEAFEKQQDKKLKDAEKFALLQKMSEKETVELINNVKAKLEKEKNEYNTRKEFCLGLFDYKEEDNNIVEDYDKPKQIIKKLTDLGYHAFLIDNIKIIKGIGQGIGKVSPKYLNENYDIITNGTFFSSGYPIGTIITKYGQNYETDHFKAVKRGGFAVLKSGISNIKLCNGNSIKKIVSLFEDKQVINEIELPEIHKNDEVEEFIGGGGLLIDNYNLVNGKDLLNIQLFNQSQSYYDEKGNLIEKTATDGFASAQMYKTQHLLIGKHNELDYLITTSLEKKNCKNCKTIQEDLNKLGFSHLIKFDGGHGLFIDSNIEKYKFSLGKDSPSGFAVKVVKI